MTTIWICDLNGKGVSVSMWEGGGGGGVGEEGGVKTIIFGICLCTFTLSPPVIKTSLLLKVSAVVIVCFSEARKRHPAVQAVEDSIYVYYNTCNGKTSVRAYLKLQKNSKSSLSQ